MTSSWSRRGLLGALLAAGCAPGGLRKVQADLISPMYGAFPGEGEERRHALALLESVLPEGLRREVSWAGAAQAGIDALAAMILAQQPSVDGALVNAGAGPVLVEPAEAHERMVVFSDHHLGPSTHRHNVFSGAGGAHFRHANHALYEQVLARYQACGFTVVENGDVEDLVVFDPYLHPGEFERRRRLVTEGGHDPGSAYEQHRDRFRADLLAQTLSDPVNQAYYARLSELDEAGRLVRIAGNHDHMRLRHWDEAVARAQTARPGFRFPTATRFGSAFVLSRGGDWETVVMHGHQFDHASSPLQASVHGESISECLGVWYQGADRIWPWAEWCAGWCAGRPFVNRLVSGTATADQDTPFEAHTDTPFSKRHRDEVRQRLWARPLGPKLFERMFEHPVAWEYLARPGDGDGGAVFGALRAAAAGEAWFKYRHTEELLLASELPRLLGRRPPTLILGHTHEPRAGAIDAHGEPCEWYLNAAATGRFEGLIWAVEVNDGSARVVSWSADPFPSGTPARRVWSPGGDERALLVSRTEALS